MGRPSSPRALAVVGVVVLALAASMATVEADTTTTTVETSESTTTTVPLPESTATTTEAEATTATPPGRKPAPPLVEPAVVVITEVMTNPSSVLDSRGEWFEIHNPGPDRVDLTGWVVTDERSDRHVIGSLQVPAGGYAVLARLGDTARNGGVVANHVYGEDLVLLNQPDRLVLLRPDGSEADRVDWGVAGFPWPRGRSMALRDPAADNAVGSSWCLSTTAMWGGDLGSPGGRTNCSESTVDLVITEILQNPRATGDFVGEWFEVLNRGEEPVDLAGFVVKDDDRDRFVIDDSVPIGPGEHVVIGRNANRRTNGSVDVAYAYGDAMALHNSSDELVLLDPDGVQVDRVAWDDGATFPDPNGASMVLADPAAEDDRGSAWCTAQTWWAGADRGTPGTAGGCTPPEPAPAIVVTEIMFDPLAVGDREGEWFELSNLEATPVDLSGWVVRDDHGDRFTIDDLTIPAGGRVVLAEVGDPSTNGGVDAAYVYGTDFHLHNSVDELVLETADGVLVDRIRWGTRRGFPDPTGASIELRDVTADNALGANWCVATDPYGAGDLGTPGVGGPCAPPGPAPQLVVTEIMRNPAAVPDDDGEWFEVHNPTDTTVDLHGWRISDLGSELHRIGRSVEVPPGGFVVLGRSDRRSSNGGVDVAYAYGAAIRLSNGADELVLSDPHGRAVDRIEWDGGTEWIRPNGASMALALATLDRSLPGPLAVGNEPEGWCESATTFGRGDRGSPGKPTICLRPSDPDRIVITEIHRDPAGTPDSLGEWIELHNADDHPVNLRGWVLRDDDWDEWTIFHHGSLVLKPGEYLVLGKQADPDRNGGAPVQVAYGAELILYNAVDELTLVDPKNNPVDRVRWRRGDGFPGSSGVSAQRLAPFGDGLDPDSWCDGVIPYATGNHGTPGGPTVCERPAPPPLPDGVDPGLSPILECVEARDGRLVARFGYENREEFEFSLPGGPTNRLVGPVLETDGPVTDFVHPHVVPGRPGRTPFGEGAFSVAFEPEGTIVWTLHGRTATAAADSTRCEG